jgi:hypothetical protein
MKPEENGGLKPTQFRLACDTLAELDAIAARLTHERGSRQGRTDALRFAVREAAKKIRKK